MKLKIRHIIAALLVIASIALTPASIEAAYQFRGYEAYGGEYLIIPLGIILALVVLQVAKVWDLFITEQTHDKLAKYNPESEE